MTKVWLVEYLEYGDVSVYSDDCDPTDIQSVKTELEYLDNDSYRDEHDAFLDDLDRVIRRDGGSAEIEERIRVSLVEVHEV